MRSVQFVRCAVFHLVFCIFAHCGQIHWAFTGKIANHSKRSERQKDKRKKKKNERHTKKREWKRCKSKEYEYTQICYDRIWRQMKEKKGEKQKNNKCRTKASDELNTLWGVLAACWCAIFVVVVVVQFERNAFRVVLVNLISMMLRQDWLTSIVIARSKLLI